MLLRWTALSFWSQNSIPSTMWHRGCPGFGLISNDISSDIAAALALRCHRQCCCDGSRVGADGVFTSAGNRVSGPCAALLGTAERSSFYFTISKGVFQLLSIFASIWWSYCWADLYTLTFILPLYCVHMCTPWHVCRGRGQLEVRLLPHVSSDWMCCQAYAACASVCQAMSTAQDLLFVCLFFIFTMLMFSGISWLIFLLPYKECTTKYLSKCSWCKIIILQLDFTF